MKVAIILITALVVEALRTILTLGVQGIYLFSGAYTGIVWEVDSVYNQGTLSDLIYYLEIE
eukprot:CAMPEP_0170511828 /NCGR_PEP_ID=MMETSP0208-20121228/66516_1 /TAXON_ID=197538 /ORGANISM="Strombidium inclinatum, Strain S3" /LENGTH=60 /DNA_ID=CAMNT_0010795397 /DNA_START=1015 /DNA_END=1194 /DNA_ORIENTATION=-